MAKRMILLLRFALNYKSVIIALCRIPIRFTLIKPYLELLMMRPVSTILTSVEINYRCFRS
jgi:hypothetical protein